jgi:hypothetical protein
MRTVGLVLAGFLIVMSMGAAGAALTNALFFTDRPGNGMWAVLFIGSAAWLSGRVWAALRDDPLCKTKKGQE